MRSLSAREKVDYEQRLDALLDELVATRALLAACTELGTPDPIEMEIQARSLETCVASLTACHAKLLKIQQYVTNCKQFLYMPTVWELELLLDDLRGNLL